MLPVLTVVRAARSWAADHAEAPYYADAYAWHYHGPAELVHAIIRQESNCNQHATSQRWIELLPPQVELGNPEGKAQATEHDRKKHDKQLEGGGWPAEHVVMRADGNLIVEERYNDVKSNPPSQAEFFDPEQFAQKPCEAAKLKIHNGHCSPARAAFPNRGWSTDLSRMESSLRSGKNRKWARHLRDLSRLISGVPLRNKGTRSGLD